MSTTFTLDLSLTQRVAALLIARKQTLAVSESSSGGLISAALLSVPGASAYFVGGGVIYTAKAREALLGITPEQMEGMRSATPEAAKLYASTVRRNMQAHWGLAETGATGPAGNRYGDEAGHCCLAVDGSLQSARVLETGSGHRMNNMVAFANAALALLEQTLSDADAQAL